VVGGERHDAVASREPGDALRRRDGRQRRVGEPRGPAIGEHAEERLVGLRRSGAGEEGQEGEDDGKGEAGHLVSQQLGREKVPELSQRGLHTA
jgi:hypothetical protein